MEHSKKQTEEAYIDLEYKTEDELVTDKLEMLFIELKKFKQKNLEACNIKTQWL